MDSARGMHDLEVQEQMMLEMVSRPQFLRDHLEVALEVEKLRLRQRNREKAHLEKYSLRTPESDEFRRAKEWVKFLAVLAVGTVCHPVNLHGFRSMASRVWFRALVLYDDANAVRLEQDSLVGSRPVDYPPRHQEAPPSSWPRPV